MFVISFKSKAVKKIIICALVVVLSVLSVVLFRCGFVSSDASQQVSHTIDDSESVLSFILDLGWTVDENPDEIREVIIPVEFDDVYMNYNDIQKKQNYDLSRYAGERVKKWTYTIRNYPGYENVDYIKINVLVFDGEVIGGDVCSVKLDGFMHGFTYENS